MLVIKQLPTIPTSKNLEEIEPQVDRVREVIHANWNGDAGYHFLVRTFLPVYLWSSRQCRKWLQATGGDSSEAALMHNMAIAVNDMMLQKYGFTVCYERSKNMHLANMLLQAFLPFEGDDEDHLKFMNMVSYLPISNKCIDEMNAKTWRAYPKSSSRVGQKKRNLPVNWLTHISICRMSWLFKMDWFSKQMLWWSLRIFVQTWNCHLGTESCLRRACECIYWPGISSEIKQYSNEQKKPDRERLTERVLMLYHMRSCSRSHSRSLSIPYPFCIRSVPIPYPFHICSLSVLFCSVLFPFC